MERSINLLHVRFLRTLANTGSGGVEVGVGESGASFQVTSWLVDMLFFASAPPASQGMPAK